MALAQHRAPREFTVPTRWAAAVAVGVGVVIGLVVWIAVLPGHRPVTTGILLGMMLGLPAMVAVVFARRTVAQGVSRWLVGALGVLGLLVVAALLFALSQVDAGQAPLGALAGVVTGLVSLAVGLSQWGRGAEPEARVHERR